MCGEGIDSNRSFVHLKLFRSVFCLFYDFISRSVRKVLLHVFEKLYVEADRNT